MIETIKEITVLHVIGPIGDPICPECKSNCVMQRGCWDEGPFYWQCDDCNHQWGHA